MATGKNNSASVPPMMSASEVEFLVAEVAAKAAAFGGATKAKSPFKDAAPPRENAAPLLSPRQLRQVRLHQEGFAANLAARLSGFLRVEFTVKLAGVQMMPYQRMTESWPEPAHLTLFKTEPLRGVSILEIPTRLAMCIVDRLMGGPGQPGHPAHEMSAIENALLEQFVQMVVGEWCGHGARVQELKPAVLGFESSARFLQTSPPQAAMLVVMLDVSVGACREQMQMGFPFAALEPLLRQLAPEIETMAEPVPVAPAAPALRWNRCFDDVNVPVGVEWTGLEMAAREVLNLRVGDVLKIDAVSAQQVTVRVGEKGKFQGRLGAVAGKWAVELTEAVKPNP